MRTLLSLSLSIVAAFGLFSATLASGQVPPEDIPLYPPIPPGNQPHSPQLSPVMCYLYSNSESLALSSNTITENAFVLLENTTTGSYRMEEIYISPIPEIVLLLGQGNYSITITLSSGSVFFGSFSFCAQ